MEALRANISSDLIRTVEGMEFRRSQELMKELSFMESLTLMQSINLTHLNIYS